MFSFSLQHHQQLSDRELLIKILENQNHMSTAIQDFAVKQDAHNAAIVKGIADLATTLDTLNAEIKTLQTSSGAITPEDQATLDRLDAAGTDAVAKLAAIDQLTPPAVPVAPPAA